MGKKNRRQPLLPLVAMTVFLLGPSISHAQIKSDSSSFAAKTLPLVMERVDRVERKGEYLYVIDEPGAELCGIPCLIPSDLKIFRQNDHSYDFVGAVRLEEIASEFLRGGLYLGEQYATTMFNTLDEEHPDSPLYMQIKNIDISDPFQPRVVSEKATNQLLLVSKKVGDRVYVLSTEVSLINNDENTLLVHADSSGSIPVTTSVNVNEDCQQLGPISDSPLFNVRLWLTSYSLDNPTRFNTSCIDVQSDNLLEMDLYASAYAVYPIIVNDGGTSIFRFIYDKDTTVYQWLFVQTALSVALRERAWAIRPQII